MEEYGIPNAVGIGIHLSKDWLSDGNDLRTSIDEPVYTDVDNEEDPGYLLSSENIAAHDIKRICIYYEEFDENEQIHIHEFYSIDLPDAGK